MRPTADVDDRDVFECYDCGGRQTDPADRHCPSCGSEMRNLGRPRDL